MLVLNRSSRQFSLEGVVIEPGQTKNLPDEQANRFIGIYAHTGSLVEVQPEPEPVAQATPEVVTEPVPEPTVIEKVEEAVSKAEDAVEAVVQPALKVFKRGRKPKTQ